MNSKFFDLKKEKQDRMMNAGLKIFAKNGYRKASTDDIVAEAGISKGLLFHYFESKLGLYAFLYDYSVRFMTMELTAAVASDEKNLFAIARSVENAKLNVLKGYPYMQLFLNCAKREDVSEALLATEEKRCVYQTMLDGIYAKADFEAFPSIEDGQRIANMLKFTMDGLMMTHMAEGSYHPQMCYEESMEYIDTLERVAHLSIR